MVINQQYVESPFTETVSLAVFTATAVGGLGSVVGAVVGAALVEGSAVFLPPSWQLFPAAFGVVLVLLAFPGGVSSLAVRRPATAFSTPSPADTASSSTAAGVGPRHRRPPWWLDGPGRPPAIAGGGA